MYTCTLVLTILHGSPGALKRHLSATCPNPPVLIKKKVVTCVPPVQDVGPLRERLTAALGSLQPLYQRKRVYGSVDVKGQGAGLLRAAVQVCDRCVSDDGITDQSWCACFGASIISP